MSESYDVLGQSAPLAVTLTDAYTVPPGRSAVLSSIIICNRSATPTSYRLSIAPLGAADADKQYLCYDRPLGANETHEVTVGVTLGTGGVVRVYNTLATCSFNIFGAEIT